MTERGYERCPLFDKGVTVVALVKNDEAYVWMYRLGQEGEAISSLGRMAANSELSLSWFDAAQIATKMKGGKQ